MMGDIGDDRGKHREWKRRVRRHWHDCPNCALSYRTDTSVAPGCKCQSCDCIATRTKGEDVHKARKE